MKTITDLLSTKTQAVLAFSIILFGFAFLIWAKAPDTTNARVEDLMFLVGTFYYGSSKSGANKDETISNLAQSQQQPIIGNSQTTNVNP